MEVQLTRNYFALLVVLLLGLATVSVALAAKPSNPRVEILTDQAAGLFRFVIDGKAVAILDSKGFHVRGDIDYSGSLSDNGEAGFMAINAQSGEVTNAP